MINEYIHKLRLPAVLCVSADGLSICGAIVSVDTVSHLTLRLWTQRARTLRAARPGPGGVFRAQM